MPGVHLTAGFPCARNLLVVLRDGAVDLSFRAEGSFSTGHVRNWLVPAYKMPD